jgi:hypothetical protein
MSATYYILQFYDIASPQIVGSRLMGHGQMRASCFSPEETLITSCSWDETIAYVVAGDYISKATTILQHLLLSRQTAYRSRRARVMARIAVND